MSESVFLSSPSSVHSRTEFDEHAVGCLRQNTSTSQLKISCHEQEEASVCSLPHNKRFRVDLPRCAVRVTSPGVTTTRRKPLCFLSHLSHLSYLSDPFYFCYLVGIAKGQERNRWYVFYPSAPDYLPLRDVVIPLADMSSKQLNFFFDIFPSYLTTKSSVYSANHSFFILFCY